MNKKILYSFSFLTLFILSTIQPVVAGDYEFPVPDAAIGIVTKTNIKLYDEGMWKDVVGDDLLPDDIWDNDGDVDVQGAKSKSKVTEIKEGEQLKGTDVADDELSLVVDMDAALKGDIAALVDGIIKNLNNNQSWIDDGTIANLTAYLNIIALGIMTEAEIIANYEEKFDCWMVIRDKWNFVKGAFPSSPNKADDEVPFIEDPKDVLNLFLGIKKAIEEILPIIDNRTLYINGFIGQINSTHLAYLTALPSPNNTLYTDLSNIAGAINILLGGLANSLDKYLYKEDFLWDAFTAGIPVMAPVEDFLEEIIDIFDEDAWTVDGVVVTYETSREEDYTVEFTYGDTGTQDSVIFLNDDGEEFYIKLGMPIVIPGYDLFIVLGLSAIFIIGLIYIINKKRT